MIFFNCLVETLREHNTLRITLNGSFYVKRHFKFLQSLLSTSTLQKYTALIFSENLKGNCFGEDDFTVSFNFCI